MSINDIQKNVSEYYTEKLRAYGPVAKGVDWNSPESQMLRFRQLLKVCNGTDSFSINDYGCGYGALIEYMITCGYAFKYRGYDLSEEMVEKARKLHENIDHCEFFTNNSSLETSDFTIASGIFNVKLQIKEDEWEDYILVTLRRIAELSKRGFSFNALTKYSDKEHMRTDLYYADPLVLFDYCKSNFSKYVALLHDYPLYEFTILVKY